MIIYEKIYNEVLSLVRPAPPETGGVLGLTNGVVAHFAFDKGLVQAPCCYVPDVQKLNGVIEKWQNEGIDFGGIVHSHTPHEKELSEGDKEYITKILACMPLEYKTLYFPLIIEKRIIPYKVRAVDGGIEISREEIIILKEGTNDEGQENYNS